jgi:hypothetical protein
VADSAADDVLTMVTDRRPWRTSLAARDRLRMRQPTVLDVLREADVELSA